MPSGTVVSTPDGRVIADLVGAGTRVVLAAGRQGRARQRRAGQLPAQGPRLRPARRAGRGLRRRHRAQERRRRRAGRLPVGGQVLADRGDVGGPARRSPTTRSPRSCPNLGVIRSGDTVYTMADVPGLIPGASTGKGLGLQFLRHVERCAVLVHVVDMATMEPGRDPESDIEALEHELAEYGGDETRPGRPAADRRPQQDRRPGRPGARRPRPRLAGEARPGGLPGQRGDRGGAARVRLRAWPRAVEEHRASLPPMEPARVTITPEGRRRQRLHRRARPGRRRGLRRPRRPARALGAADRLHQRRGRRLPRRPAQPARRRGAAGQGRRPRGRRRHRSAGSPSTGCRPCPPGRSRSRSPPAWAAAAPTARIDAPHRVRAEERLAAKKARRMPYELSERTWTRRRPPGRTCRDDAGLPRPVREIAGARRVVVKVGSSSLTTLPGGLDAGAARRRWSTSSAPCAPRGARSCWSPPARSPPAWRRCGLGGRPRDLATAQAAASVGQLRLVQTYADAFARHGITVGQVLLTADDLTRRSHYRNAQPDGGAAAGARACCRSSTRTTRWPPRRSGSATTTGSPRWSPTSRGPTRSSCSPTSTASTTATRASGPPS